MTKEQNLRSEVEILLGEIKELLSTYKWNKAIPAHAEKWEAMVQKAVELHTLVKPKHHDYMIRNRGCSPDDPEFYNHIHPIEDLLAFMDDPHANDDQEDITIGHDFTLPVYIRRWEHKGIYKLKRTDSGWYVDYPSISGNCDESGNPFLFENLNHDSVNYPEELSGYMEWLWEQAAEKGLSHEQVQNALDELGEWISTCEKNSPKGEIWEAFK